MSDCSTSTEAPSSEEQEPTIVSMPVVGSSATDNMATSWDSSTSMNVQESSSELCNLSLCNDTIPSSATASLTCSSEISSAMSHRKIVSPETDSNTFVTSGITQDADSTSGSMGIGNDERMIVDGPLSSNLSLHSVVPPEAVSQESDISEDHINVIENITARRFLRESDLLNAAASALHHTNKTLSRNGNDIRKSNISQRLMSLEHHQSVSSTQEPEPMEMPNLLHDQHNLDGESVSSLADYHLDHSQTSDMPVGSSSHLDMGSVLPGSMRAESVCLSPSSTSSTSSLDLPSGSCISTGIGLPPVSTIIRSSASYTKGRFEAFCRPSNISLIMGIPQFLNHSSSFEALTSMGAIQQMPSSPCDALTSVTLASPLDVSVRHDSCSDITMESVDVPLSSSVCSSTSSEHIDTIVGSGCIKATSVMSLGPDMITKQNPLSEMSEAHSHPDNNINLSFSRSTSVPRLVGNIPIQHMVNINSSQSQVSLSALEDVQHKVKSIGDHLDSGTPVSTAYTLGANDESLAHAMIASNFNCRDEMVSSDNFAEQIDQSSQSSALLPVSAIETNVIMSTSAIDSVPKLASTELKIVQTHNDMQEEHIQRLQTNQQLDNQELTQQIIIPRSVETSRSCDIIYSAVQNILSNTEVDATKVYTSIRKKAMHLEIPTSRTSIIEKNIQHVHIPNSDSSVSSGAENEQISSMGSAVLSSLRENDSVLSKSPKIQSKIIMEDSDSGPLTTVSPSAVTASVIQQLLKSHSSPVKLTPIMQRIPGGVITSVMSIKDESSTIHKETNLNTSSLKHECHLNIDEDSSDLSIGKTLVSPENTVMSSISGKRMSNVNDDFDESSLEKESIRSPVLSASLHTEKEASSLASVAFPSLFSNISANTLASLQSNLSSVHTIPLSISSSLSAASLIPTTVSLLSPVSSGLSSPTASAMPSIVLPSILSSTLRNAATAIKTSVSSPNSMSSASSNIYTGLLKSVGLSAVVKQEPGISSESGSLPPFTVVSGLSPLIKRELNTTLTTTLLGATLSNSQIPIVNVKQEPGLTDPKTNACEFTASTILGDGSNLSDLTSSHIPSVERSDATSSTATTTVPTSSVPSHASTITFARNTSVATAATSSGTSIDTNNKEEKAIIKKWNCPMCKNGSPCGIHPTQSQGSSSQATPQPLLSGDPAKPFQCNLCGKHLASKNVYQLHLRSHSGEKPFTCNLCGHHFSQKTSLTRHMRSHTGERPFPCDVCGKRFADKERIKIHMRTHTGEKPFACEVCGKRFSQKSTVKRHMSVHTGEKPFKCESCGKGFANRGNLNAHSKTHANT